MSKLQARWLGGSQKCAKKSGADDTAELAAVTVKGN